jgi:L-fuconolactonase
MKIDSHHHLWAINETDYAWMTDEHAAIRRDYLTAELEETLAPAGISGSIAVQARQMPQETEFLLGLARSTQRIFGVVGWVPLLHGAGEPWLERFAADPKLVGLRHVVHDEPDDSFILGDAFNMGIRRLAHYQLVYDILIFARHLPATLQFVDRHPAQPFVVDHIAKPAIAAGAFDTAWAAGIRDLARRPHVSIKLSGMVTEVRDATWSIELLRPYFETVIEAFGPSRVMFGSDWPVCLLRASYQDWVNAVESMISGLSLSEREEIWSGTARRIYRLDPG